ncbi:MAG: 50S ribosomal protein L9 [Alphaproteobacteria bacterium]|jgi:large subunit ribosomal protein L9|nr:50S ribosomal protein L9 [Candidatus Jidaibacter sp.]
MQVIMLEKVGKLNEIGSVVEVKNGYARYLILRKKAMRATTQNIKFFEEQRAEIEKTNAAKRSAAEAMLDKFADLEISISRQAGDDGRLFGSVSNKDIAQSISEKIGHKLDSECVNVNTKIKEVGMYQIDIALHSEVHAKVSLTVSRSEAA